MGVHPFHKKEEVCMAVRKWLCMHKSDFYCDRILTLMQKWDKCISVFGGYIAKQ